MRVLCPVDFSSASITACGWAARLLQTIGGGELELLHCINVVSRSAMFIKMDNVFREQAEADFQTLVPKLNKLAPAIKLVSTVVNQDPKVYILSVLKKRNYDLIVTGTKGLSALKEMTVGSTTAFLMNHTSTPLVSIPDDYEFQGINKIVIGVDEEVSHAEALSPVLELARKCGAVLVFINTTADQSEVDVASYKLPLEGIPNEVLSIPLQESIPQTLTTYCEANQGDLLVMVHRRRHWLERLFRTSLTKEKLFNINTPLFILPTNGN